MYTGHKIWLCCRHIPRLYDFLWVAEDGMKMQGYNGSQLWDTTFAVQAICATGLAHEFDDCLRRAHHYVDVTQASLLWLKMQGIHVRICFFDFHALRDGPFEGCTEFHFSAELGTLLHPAKKVQVD